MVFIQSAQFPKDGTELLPEVDTGISPSYFQKTALVYFQKPSSYWKVKVISFNRKLRFLEPEWFEKLNLDFLELTWSCLDCFKYLGISLYVCDMRTCPQVNAKDNIPQISHIQFVLPAFKSANLNIFYQ